MDSPRIALYDASQIPEIPWPNTPEGDYARRFLTPLLADGITHYIDNIQTSMRVMVCDGNVFPVTINESEYINSYVCSPYSYFISYALESLAIVQNRPLRKGIEWTLTNLGKMLRACHLNKVVVVNNWPFSTNLYPKIDPTSISKMTHYLQKHFPEHAIVFRSIDQQTNADCFTSLKQNSYALIAARQIFLTHTPTTEFFSSRLFKSDLKVLNTSGYEVVENPVLSEEEQERVLELYENLYITKYSGLNPKLNLNFIRLALNQRGLNFKILKKEGSIDGIIGYQHRNGVLMCPFFGYDQTKPLTAGLYRNLSTLLLLQAQKDQALFHQSAGASKYKSMRKAQTLIEYLAVNHCHLPLRRKAAWILLASLLNSVGVKFMSKY